MKEKESSRREERIRITRGKIDLASIKPPGIEIKVTKRYIVLRKDKSRITIQRYVDARKFALMLGLQRSDGAKGSNRVRFSNNNPILHRWFIEALKEMNISKISAHCYYCNCRLHGRRKLREVIRRFEEATSVKVKKIYVDEQAHNPLLQVDVNNVALERFLNYAERIFRRLAVRKKMTIGLVLLYLRGVIMGDGNYNIKEDRTGNLIFHLRIYEQKNTKARKELQLIFRKYLGIKLREMSDKSLVASINTINLLKLLKLGLIPEEYYNAVGEKLEHIMSSDHIISTLLRLYRHFGNNQFTSTDAAMLLKRQRHHMLETLKILESKGLLSSKKIKLTSANKPGTPIRRVFKITDDGIEIINLSSLFLSYSKC